MNKRAAKKIKTQQINRYINELKKVLEKEGLTKVLETELTKARLEISSIKHKRVKPFLKETTKLISFNLINIPKIIKSKQKKERKTLAFGYQSKRTQEQYLQQTKAEFINRFIKRIANTFPEATSDELAALQTKMVNMDIYAIDTILELIDNRVRDLYYESDAIFYSTSSEDLYENILKEFAII